KNSASRTITLLIILSVVYTILDTNIIYLLPIITIIIPYKFMQEKDLSKEKQNRRLLSNLFLFNILTFIGAMLITNKSSLAIIELVTNILITFVYYKIICSVEKKREDLINNPEKQYQKIKQKINVLETIYTKTEEELQKEQNEKKKVSLEAKLDAIKVNINQYKQKLEFIERQIELKKSKQL
ncbi:MAG: hypothetical protein IJH34_00365, partial [Romboutsia sp.]|nr:hypothetical protein [Romboutsia sp.]